eukprot:TRINITY_DN528_c0_g1_i2.p2 TRINITY_DN528_c0_g1~~TRINITY_DN528_c0_g1_i2.p2  ORF type:complete len:168 (-),score=15.65 TRINITY_DN528_c0_g1_i2:97-600(-)
MAQAESVRAAVRELPAFQQTSADLRAACEQGADGESVTRIATEGIRLIAGGEGHARVSQDTDRVDHCPYCYHTRPAGSDSQPAEHREECKEGWKVESAGNAGNAGKVAAGIEKELMTFTTVLAAVLEMCKVVPKAVGCLHRVVDGAWMYFMQSVSQLLAKLPALSNQ